MQPPAFTPDEPERLLALSRYDILDTPAEAEFDDITQLASDICETPIGLITLLDMNRQWFKSKVGVPQTETERDISFCGHAILNEALFEIPDALQDQRFADNPLVTGDPHIRFYAGAPLITSDGFRLGTLCVLDRVPRTLSERQRRTLQALSRQVVRQMEVRNMARELALKSHFQAAVLNSPDLVLISTTVDGVINGFNRAAEILLGYQAGTVIGKRSLEFCYEPLALASRAEEFAGPAESNSNQGFDLLITDIDEVLVGSGDWMYRCKDGSLVPVHVAITPILDNGGAVLGYLSTARNVSDLKRAEHSHREALDFIQKIAKRVPGMIYQFRQRADGSYCFPYASLGMQAIYRVNPEDVIEDASAVLSRIHPDDAAGVRESILASARDLTPWQHEYRIRYDDDTVRWAFGNAVPERFADGGTLWNGFITDVTDQKAAALALESSKQFLQTLIDHLPVGIYSKRLNAANETGSGKIEVWNRAAESMSGIRAVDAIGRKNEDIFDPETARMYTEYDRLLLETKAPVIVPVYPAHLPDGSTRLLRMTSLPLFDTGGNVAFALGIAEDITEQTQRKKELRQRKAELEGVNDASPLGLFHTDQNGAITYVNRTFEHMSGLARAAVLNIGWRQAVHPDDVERVVQDWQSATQASRRYEGAHRFLHLDGRVVMVNAIAVPIIVDGITTGFVGTIDDITERHADNERIAASEKRLRTITDNVPAVIGYIDAGERYRFCNIHYRTLLGLDPVAMIGRSLQEIYGESAYEKMKDTIHAALSGKRMSFERPLQHNGVTKYLQCEYVPDIDDGGRVLGFYALVTDVTALKKIEEELRHLARFDSLTGLPNRPHLFESLDASIDRSKRSGLGVAVLFLDIDNFKTINDTLGHRKGDLVLQEFATRLTRAVRTTDTVARLAGDEFVIILESLKNILEAEMVARKILATIQKPWLLNGEKLVVTTSIGIAYDPHHAHAGSDLIEYADASLYEAKSAGRNQFNSRIC